MIVCQYGNNFSIIHKKWCIHHSFPQGNSWQLSRFGFGNPLTLAIPCVVYHIDPYLTEQALSNAK